MPIQYLLDEHLRGPLWRAIQRHNDRGDDRLEAVRVGDTSSPTLGTPDPQLLLWIEHNRRILVSEDQRTLPSYLERHLRAGHHCPGLFMIRKGSTVREVLEFLVLAACCSQEGEWQDRIIFIP